MLDVTNVSIASLAIHRVGNKLRQEGVVLTKRLHPLSKETEPTLLNFFLKPFTGAEVFQFSHTSDLKLNELWNFSKNVFEDSKALLKTSVSAAKHLYQCSEHPKIKSGEVYFALLKDVNFGGEIVDALGIFKSETKDLFLKVSDSSPEMLAIDIQKGTNLKHLDKGCIILNTSPNDGYRVLIVDNNDSTRFWQDTFLTVTPTRDDHFYTNECIGICQKFSDEVFDEEAERKDQILFLKKSVEYFSNSEKFDLNDFSKTVFKDKATATKFKTFKSEYEEKSGLPPLNSFTVSQPTIKKAKRRFKDFIRLDTKIEVKLRFTDSDANATNVERGFDSKRKMHFYKLYFNKEI